MRDAYPELENVTKLYTEDKLHECLELLETFWAELPEPKHEVLNSHIVVMYGVSMSKKIADLDRAWIWAHRSLVFVGNTHLAGESELLLGDIAYLRGDFEAAKEYFKLTFKKSSSRLFKEQNPKYLELAKER
jgi:hypothetical protein